MRDKRFTFLCNNEERKLLDLVADHFRRSRSDTVRWLIIKAARELRLDHDHREYEGGDQNNGWN
jgi:hypothetical protein